MFLHLGGLFFDEGLFTSRNGTEEEEGTGDEVRLGAEGGTIRMAADGRGGTNGVDMTHKPRVLGYVYYVTTSLLLLVINNL